MGTHALTTEQRNAARVSVLVIMLVLALFVLILVAGDPILHFQTQPPSVAYALGVYAPVIALCLVAYRRLGRS